MRVLIFGATGPSGIALTRKVLEVYPSSTILLYVRSPQKIPDDLAQHASIFVIRGELTELDEIEAALLGRQTAVDAAAEPQPVDVVLSALGPPGPGHLPDHPFAKFYSSLMDLMSKHSVKRIILLCTGAYADPQDKFNLVTYVIGTVVKIVAYNSYADFQAIGEVVSENGNRNSLEWTLVRVPLLTNSENEKVLGGYVGDGKIGNILARKAFAAFCVGEIEKREWVGKAPFISGHHCL